MSLTNLQLIRKKLADDYKFGHDTNLGDGYTNIFQVSHGNIQDETYEVYVDESLVSTDDYSVDLERGIIEFDTAPTDGDEVDVRYYFSAFSDTEINEFLDQNNDNVDKTVRDLIDILLADSSRRFDYSTGKTEMKPSQVFDNLTRLREIYSEKSQSEVKIATVRSKYDEPKSRVISDLSRQDL